MSDHFEKYKEEELKKFLAEIKTVSYTGEIATGPGGELSLSTAQSMLESSAKALSKEPAVAEPEKRIKMPSGTEQGNKMAVLLQRFGIMQKKPGGPATPGQEKTPTKKL